MNKATLLLRLQGPTPLLILAMQGVAFWPVWRWYGERITDGSDEPWGIVALATHAIESGAAAKALDRLVAISNGRD